MKHIFSYIGYFLLVFFTNIVLYFLMGYVSSLLNLTVDGFYLFIAITLSFGIIYTHLSVNAVYKKANIIKPQKREKIIISSIFFLFYIGVWWKVFFILMSSFKGAI